LEPDVVNHRAAIWILIAVAAGCRPAPPRSGDIAAPPRTGGPLKIALATGITDAAIRLSGPCEVRCDGSRWIESDGATLRFDLRDGRIVLSLPRGGEANDARSIRIAPAKEGAGWRWRDTPYAGVLVVSRDAERLSLVNEVDVEVYLRGVVPWEIGRPGADAQAAVEAQTIAARTYAESRRGQFPLFDLWADERDQVYRGLERPDPVADRAIAATRGLVLEHRGDLIQAYYSSTCGGHTARIEEVWDKPAAAYLAGGRDANADEGPSFCRDSPHFRWAEAWSGADLESTIRTTLPRALGWPVGRDPGALIDLRLGDRDRSGRARTLDVVTTTGTHRVRGDAMRWVLKPKERPLLRSTMFVLEVERRDGAIVRVAARGGGNGHGVGMCQTGALSMARSGYDRAAILARYYPGARLQHAD
jgi:stage II sporulation protein D